MGRWIYDLGGEGTLQSEYNYTDAKTGHGCEWDGVVPKEGWGGNE